MPEPPTHTSQAVPTRLEPERYGIHFTASEEYVTLVAEAQALLSHSAPRISLDELHLRAMRALVAELKRKKYALHAPARKLDEPTVPATAQRPNQDSPHAPERKPDEPTVPATAQRANEDSRAEPARVVERDELPRRDSPTNRAPTARRRTTACRPCT